MSFAELPCKDQELFFEVLHHKLEEHIQTETFNIDTLKTLNSHDNISGYNNAAGLLQIKLMRNLDCENDRGDSSKL